MELKLPSSVTGRKELLKLRRDIEAFKQGMLDKRIASKTVKVKRAQPEASAALIELIDLNKLDQTEAVLSQVDHQLAELFRTAPQIRMTFASEPEAEPLSKIVDWIRQNVDGKALINIGIQPSIAGGVIIRTDKRRYDLSLKTALNQSAKKFIQAVRDGVSV